MASGFGCKHVKSATLNERRRAMPAGDQLLGCLTERARVADRSDVRGVRDRRVHAGAPSPRRLAATPGPAHQVPVGRGCDPDPARGERSSRCSHRPAARARRGATREHADGRCAGSRRSRATPTCGGPAGTRQACCRTAPPHDTRRGTLRVALPLPGFGDLWLLGRSCRDAVDMTSIITPISTPFGFHSTAAEVLADVDLAGKRAIVTGAASASASRRHARWLVREPT